MIVELKLSFGLPLVLQGVDRLALTDRVYLAVSRPRGRRARRAPVHRRDVRDLCRRLGFGLMTVEPGRERPVSRSSSIPCPTGRGGGWRA